MGLSTDRTYRRWIKYLFLAFVFPPLYYFVCSSGTLSCEKSITQEHRKLFGNKKSLLRLYGAQCLMRVGCTCEPSSVYLNSAQTVEERGDHTNRPSCTLTQPQSAAVDISHMAVISAMSTGSFVCVCGSWGCGCKLITHHHNTLRSPQSNSESRFSFLFVKTSPKNTQSAGVILLLCELSALLDSLSVL